MVTLASPVCPNNGISDNNEHAPVFSSIPDLPFMLDERNCSLKAVRHSRFPTPFESDQAELAIAPAPMPVLAAMDLKSPSAVTKTALLASATAATNISGESGLFSRANE